MRPNWVRQKLQAGKPTLGAFLGLGSPNVAELMAHAGFDWLLIETEHNGLDSAEVEHMLMAVNATEAIPIVRVPSASHVYIQRALDMGGLGVMVPMVRTAAEAEAIVRATRYPPQGTRGFGALRASHYTFDNEHYFRHANDNILVALIIETKEAVQNLEAIAAVAGIDALYLGLMDLSLSLGFDPMRKPFPDPAVEAVIDRTLAVGKQSGVAIGIGGRTPELLRNRLERGFTFVNYSSDYTALAEVAGAGVSAFKRLTQPEPTA